MNKKIETYRDAGLSLVETFKSAFSTMAGSIMLLVALALFTPSTATAQVPTYAPDNISVPLVQANMTTNLVLNTNQVLLDFSKQQTAWMEFECAWSAPGTAAGLTNAIYTLAPTIDGITYDTNRMITVTVLDKKVDNTYMSWSTNQTVPGKGWFIIQIQNTHVTGILTNFIKRGTKINCP